MYTPEQQKKIDRLKKVLDGGEVTLLEYIDELQSQIDNLTPSLEKVFENVRSILKDMKGKDSSPQEVADILMANKDFINAVIGQKGADGKDGKDGVDGKDGQDGADGKDGSPDTALQIAEKLNAEEGIIEQKVIIGLEESLNKKIEDGVQRGGGSGGLFLYTSGTKRGKVNSLNFASATYSKVNGLDTVTISNGLPAFASGRILFGAGTTTPSTSSSFSWLDASKQLVVSGRAGFTAVSDNPIMTLTQLSGQTANTFEIRDSFGNLRTWITASPASNTVGTTLMYIGAGSNSNTAGIVHGQSTTQKYLYLENGSGQGVWGTYSAGIIRNNSLGFDVLTFGDTGSVVKNGSNSVVPWAVMGYSGQYANLQEWRNSSGTVLACVDADGRLGVGGISAPSYYLEVNGDGRFAGNLKLDSTVQDSTGSYGSTGQALFNGGPNVVWGNVTATPAGSSPDIQYNNGGVLGGITSGTGFLYYNGSGSYSFTVPTFSDVLAISGITGFNSGGLNPYTNFDIQNGLVINAT